MTTIKVKLMEPIGGYEDVAEYRFASTGEHKLQTCGDIETQRQISPTLVLTPKVSLAEQMGLEVGAVYYKNDNCVVIEVTGDSECEYHDTCDRTLLVGNSSKHKLKNACLNGQWRKVINADGTMVYGDIEWVTVGSKEVTKADLRAACADEFAVPACRSHAKTCCVCDGV